MVKTHTVTKFTWENNFPDTLFGSSEQNMISCGGLLNAESNPAVIIYRNDTLFNGVPQCNIFRLNIQKMRISGFWPPFYKRGTYIVTGAGFLADEFTNNAGPAQPPILLCNFELKGRITIVGLYPGNKIRERVMQEIQERLLSQVRDKLKEKTNSRGG
jgi:hypothetical protein